MTDQQTPPKKVGSLRDRIAAFEKPAAPTGAPPPPRPKPGGVSWKPVAPSPPSPSPGAESPTHNKVSSSMNVSDAKESITKVASLKERMAALQGRGGFGAGPAPPPVKPAVEKPKWKPPPQVVPTPPEEGGKVEEGEGPGGEGDGDLDAPRAVQAPVSIIGVQSGEEVVAGQGAEEENVEGDGAAEADPEEEERQRRAAIAARMARLGGARVGMAPMFGRPSVTKKPEAVVKPAAEDVNAPETTTEAAPRPPVSRSSSLSVSSSEKPLERKDSLPTSVEVEAQHGHNPTSMPLPSAPRRAGPPRKKIPKAPEIPPTEVNPTLNAPPEDIPALTSPSEVLEAVNLTSEAHKPRVEGGGQGQIKVEEGDVQIPPLAPPTEKEPTSGTKTDVAEVVVKEEGDAALSFADHPRHEGGVDVTSAEPSAARGGQSEEDLEEPVAPVVEGIEGNDETEEAARRQRVAEKLANMGGVNPFALPPQRKPSIRDSPLPASISQEVVASPPRPLRHDEVEPVVVESVPPKRDSQDVHSLVGQSTEKTGIQGKFVESEARTVEYRHGNLDKPEVKTEWGEIDEGEDEIDEITGSVNASAHGSLSSTEPSRHLDTVERAPGSPTTVSTSGPPEHQRSTRPKSVPTGEDPALPTNPIPVPSRSSYAPARSIPPPPPRLIPQLEPGDPEDDGSGSDAAYTPDFRKRMASLSASALSSRQPSDDEEDNEVGPPRPIPPRVSGIETPPLPVPNRASFAFRARPLSPPASDVESDYGETLPRRPVTPGALPTDEVPLAVPPRVGVTEEVVKPSPLRHSYQVSTSSAGSSLLPDTEGKSGQEVLDEEEGDPIDPTFFYCPPSRRVSTTIPVSTTSRASTQRLEIGTDHEDEEPKVHRQTIAERMARLGGIKFGAAPTPGMMSPPPKLEDEGAAVPHSPEETPVEASEEEEERARKERIAAKLPGMGGMRIGMLPLGGGAFRPNTSVPPSPVRAVPPPRPPQHRDSDTDIDSSLSASFSASEDGVKVEAEESEIEEVSHEDAQGLEQEEVPPPVPSRGSRRRGTGESEASYTSTILPTRPMPNTVPPPARKTSGQTGNTVPPVRKTSGQTGTSVGRKASVDSDTGYSTRRPTAGHKPQSDYVMVEEPSSFSDDVPPPLPPGRRQSVRSPPARNVPAPPAPPGPTKDDSLSSQWELPSPSLEFSEGPDLSLSWTDTALPARISPRTSTRLSIPPPQPIPVPVAVAERQLSADELMAVWGRVGVQICEVATTLYDKSKKTLIGDGTFEGFIHAVLAEVPNACVPESELWGYLVYVQTGNAVLKRLSDILPGDVVELQDARLKGHKGLHVYNHTVEHAVGVVSEFEPKKSKVKVFQANQHVGQQTVESVSYRLEDLKSGTIKIYRVLEN